MCPRSAPARLLRCVGLRGTSRTRLETVPAAGSTAGSGARAEGGGHTVAGSVQGVEEHAEGAVRAEEEDRRGCVTVVRRRRQRAVSRAGRHPEQQTRE